MDTPTSTDVRTAHRGRPTPSQIIALGLVAAAFGWAIWLLDERPSAEEVELLPGTVLPASELAVVEAAAALKAGDPHAEDTFLGPLITEAEAIRVERWVDEAVALGARVLCGGRRDGAFYAATVLENVPRNASVSCKEVFGPVVTLEAFDDFRTAVDVVNDSDFGLQAGVFTPDLGNALYAWDHLEVGGVIIDDVPSFRVDSMPYGGVKDSGLGREGVRFALEEMTEQRLLVLRSPAAR